MSDVIDTLEIDARTDMTVFYELPEWFYSYNRSVSIKTPYCTSIVHNKQGGKFPFTDRMIHRHYVDPDETQPNMGEVRHPELAPDLIRFKPFGEDEQVYRFEVLGGDAGDE